MEAVAAPWRPMVAAGRPVNALESLAASRGGSPARTNGSTRSRTSVPLGRILAASRAVRVRADTSAHEGRIAVEACVEKVRGPATLRARRCRCPVAATSNDREELAELAAARRELSVARDTPVRLTAEQEKASPKPVAAIRPSEVLQSARRVDAGGCGGVGGRGIDGSVAGGEAARRHYPAESPIRQKPERNERSMKADDSGGVRSAISSSSRRGDGTSARRSARRRHGDGMPTSRAASA